MIVGEKREMFSVEQGKLREKKIKFSSCTVLK